MMVKGWFEIVRFWFGVQILCRILKDYYPKFYHTIYKYTNPSFIYIVGNI